MSANNPNDAAQWKGLSGAEAKARFEKYGPNEIAVKEESLFHRIFRRFWGPIPWMIEIAAILSVVVQKWEDFAIITLMLLVNVIVDFTQESKALSALKVLKNSLAKKALVLRDGQYESIDARMVVPGDIIKLKIGDITPADAKLVSGEYLQVDQAALTGESLPVSKKVGDVLYGNSVIKMGEMQAEVTETGKNTYFGKTASLVAQADKQGGSHFQKAVIRIGNFLIMLTAILAVIILLVSIYRHNPLLEDFQFILVLVVASIPVALPAVLSVTMAVGALKLARQQAVVSKLSIIEELAGIDVLCSDKTGTLTQNRMSISAPECYNDFKESDLLIYAALASRKENNDPIEMPIFELIEQHKLTDKLGTYQLEKFIPFDPVSKKTQATLKDKEGTLTIVKGAPQVILGLCPKDKAKEVMAGDVLKYANKGYRALGVALQRKENGPYILVGLIPLFDPPRTDSKEVITQAKELGTQIKMITGDNNAIAHQIADLLAIGPRILNANELRKADSSDEYVVLGKIISDALYRKLQPSATDAEIAKFSEDITRDIKEKLEKRQIPDGYIHKHESEIIGLIEAADGFSQVLPEDKYMIIDKLQKAGHIVAMTGDGVNDAPALKKADAGIAVSGATDAARAAADLVLLSPGLSVIIDAFKESRRIFERMRGYATYRIAETIRIILFMTLSIIIFNFYPVTAVMIILLALLNDIPIMMIAYDNAKSDPRPVRWNMKEVLAVASVLGFFGVIASFTLYYVLVKLQFSSDLIQTLMFLKLAVAGNTTIYVTRSGERHLWSRPFPAAKFFVPACMAVIVATLISVFGIFMKSIPVEYAALIWLYAIVWMLVNDMVKVFTFKWMRSAPKPQN